MPRGDRTGRSFSRRTALMGGTALWLVGCSSSHPKAAAVGTSARPTMSASPTASPHIVTADSAFTALQKQFDARLGVWALNTANATQVEFNADQRFAYCSTHKAFSAAAVLRNNSLDGLDTVVRYTTADLVANSPVTQVHVSTGMTLRAICDAAIRYSDNTAANILFGQLGGPAGLQSFLRTLGDDVTQCARLEPALNSAIPGDIRDTTTARAWGTDLEAVTLGNGLSADRQALLNGWLVGNLTGTGLIRAGVPAGWKVGDKTGNGDYGTRNDMAVIWPPAAEPMVMVVLSSRPKLDDSYDNDLVSGAAKVALSAIQA
jgi:beta-lactamase class A